MSAAGRRATEDCFPAFGQAIQAIHRHLPVDEQDALQYFEAVSDALQDAAGELAGGDRQGG